MLRPPRVGGGVALASAPVPCASRGGGSLQPAPLPSLRRCPPASAAGLSDARGEFAIVAPAALTRGTRRTAHRILALSLAAAAAGTTAAGRGPRLTCRAHGAVSTAQPAEGEAAAGRRRKLAAPRAEEAGRPSWQKVDDCAFLLRAPGDSPPRAVLLFAGGALVGAAPQLTYGRLLAQLADRGFWIVAVSYATVMDFVSTADLLQTRFERALSRIDFGSAPVWGFGHSLGALAQVLIASRHPAGQRRGQLLISHTRRGEEALPVVRAALRTNPVLGPLLTTMDVSAAADLLLKGAEFVERAMPSRVRGSQSSSIPSPVQDVAPLLQQMLPLLREVGIEQEKFRPGEEQFQRAVRQGYREANTLLLRLGGDGLDETPALAKLLAELPADRGVDFQVKTLNGQHLVPLVPDWNEAAGLARPLLPQTAMMPRERWLDAADQQTAIVDAISKFTNANS